MLVFVTGNKGKLAEARAFLGDIEQADLGIREIQSDNQEDVASDSAEEAYKTLGKPLFLEDAGLFIDALRGFPGVYSKYAMETIGCDGLLKLMEGVEDRGAEFRACVAYHDGRQVRLFSGACRGEIIHQKRGESGFGFDPIFVPDGRGKTFAEDADYKQLVSHRRKALESFQAYLYKGC
ncbi:MAG: RdgB/HAM1 family non-canonical purine NTP pyrophosphatase, partial [Candidatus Diapherotrites archaeon]|nr:RdgB/HAM1 family non-canonical purine NTP pyrophosphatase [Candidatus Diapherotrites archaeon]